MHAHTRPHERTRAHTQACLALPITPAAQAGPLPAEAAEVQAKRWCARVGRQTAQPPCGHAHGPPRAEQWGWAVTPLLALGVAAARRWASGWSGGWSGM